MWRVVYPCGIHFLIGQFVAAVGLVVFTYGTGGKGSGLVSHTILLTGIANLLTMIPCIHLYKRDHCLRVAGGLLHRQKGRKLEAMEGALLLVMGAACAIFANMLVALFQNILHAQEYQESMEQIMNGQSYFMLILGMGILAPIVEEMVFRWLIYLRLRDYMKAGAAAVISGVFFGVYHMNLFQAVYASILGIVFAYFLEITGSLWASVLLHMGANICSLVLPHLLLALPEKYFVSGAMAIYAVLLTVLCAGCSYFKKRAYTERCV